MISINDFQKMDLRVGRIVSAEKVEGADKLYVLKVDLGGETRQLVAGLRQHYSEDELVDKKIVVIANLEPATIRGIKSEGMLLAAQDGDSISLITVDRDIKEGSKIS